MNFSVSPVFGDQPEPLLYNKDPKDVQKIKCAQKDEFKRRSCYTCFYFSKITYCDRRHFIGDLLLSKHWQINSKVVKKTVEYMKRPMLVQFTKNNVSMFMKPSSSPNTRQSAARFIAECARLVTGMSVQIIMIFL